MLQIDSHAGGADAEWFAIHVRTGRESVCEMHLAARGYEVFLPMHVESRRWSDRMKHVTTALFPGYLFSRCGFNVVGKIVTVPGVLSIVGDGRQPLPVSPVEIASIQRIVASGVAMQPWEFVRVGQRVRLEEGPLRDVEGIIVRVKNEQRLIVSVSLLHRSVAVEIDRAWVSIQPDAASVAAL